MPEHALIIYCNCSYSQIIAEDVKLQVLNALTDATPEFEAVSDLCEMAARQDPTLKRWAKADAVKIVACFPRAVKWLFHLGNAPLRQERAEFFNMRTDKPEEIVSSLIKAEKLAQTPKNVQLDKTADWIPWFPVIDYDRCENCKQCLNFCLFGVYELSEEGKVRVTKPANCKTNCPACARICPQAAIIFPKYTDSPINGDEVDEQALQDRKANVDFARLRDGDIHSLIRQRSTMAKQLDIPQQVLNSLSAEQTAHISHQLRKGKRPSSPASEAKCDSEQENRSRE